MRFGQVVVLAALIGLAGGVVVGCGRGGSPDPPSSLSLSGVRSSGASGSGSAVPSSVVPSSVVPSSRPSGSGPSGSPARTGPLTTGPNVRPGEKPPVLSAEGRKHTVTGALDFATYYIRALDWSIATNDPYLLKQVSLPSCVACGRYIAGLVELKAKGQYQVGGRIDIHSAEVVNGQFSVKSERVVKFQLTESKPVVLPTSAQRPTNTPAQAPLTSYVFVSWYGSHWKIVEQGAPS